MQVYPCLVRYSDLNSKKPGRIITTYDKTDSTIFYTGPTSSATIDLNDESTRRRLTFLTETAASIDLNDENTRRRLTFLSETAQQISTKLSGLLNVPTSSITPFHARTVLCQLALRVTSVLLPNRWMKASMGHIATLCKTFNMPLEIKSLSK